MILSLLRLNEGNNEPFLIICSARKHGSSLRHSIPGLALLAIPADHLLFFPSPCVFPSQYLYLVCDRAVLCFLGMRTWRRYYAPWPRCHWA